MLQVRAPRQYMWTWWLGSAWNLILSCKSLNHVCMHSIQWKMHTHCISILSAQPAKRHTVYGILGFCTSHPIPFPVTLLNVCSNIEQANIISIKWWKFLFSSEMHVINVEQNFYHSLILSLESNSYDYHYVWISVDMTV